MNTLTEKSTLLDDDIKLKMVYTLNPCFEEHDYNFEQILENVDDLYHKYEQLQNFYYSMYIESFVDSSFHKNALNFIKLYNDFKGVCRLLTKIKNLISHNLKIAPMLGSEEIKVLVNFNDIKIFLDRNNLYPIIDSNYFID
jgi:hypothetical protein